MQIENVIQQTPQVTFEHPQTSTNTQGYQKHWSTCIQGLIKSYSTYKFYKKYYTRVYKELNKHERTNKECSYFSTDHCTYNCFHTLLAIEDLYIR